VGTAEVARRYAEEALDLNQSLGDSRGIAHAELVLGAIIARDDMTRARDLWESSLQRFRKDDEDHLALIATRHLAWAYENLGDRQRCLALNEENLRRGRARSETSGSKESRSECSHRSGSRKVGSTKRSSC
jgi:tetratricopeptide (TPR) repeat protein